LRVRLYTLNFVSVTEKEKQATREEIFISFEYGVASN